jgi:hypothetical protein
VVEARSIYPPFLLRLIYPLGLPRLIYPHCLLGVNILLYLPVQTKQGSRVMSVQDDYNEAFAEGKASVGIAEVAAMLDLLCGLTHVVQINAGHGWETIAAFNSETIARQYTMDCQDSPHRAEGSEYRMRSLGGEP